MLTFLKIVKATLRAKSESKQRKYKLMYSKRIKWDINKFGSEYFKEKLTTNT